MAFGGHLWKKFRSRMVTLRCEVSHVAVANVPGMIGSEVEVRYRGVTAPNLFQCTIVVENDSTTDLKDVVLNMAYKDGTIYVSGGGAIDGSNQVLLLTPAFVEANNLSMALSEEERNQRPEWHYTSTRRDFVIPTLNRRMRARFLFTVHGATAALPELTLSCDHLGVRLLLQAPRQLVLGVPTNQAAITGVVAGGLLLWLAPSFVNSAWQLTWAFFIAASAAQMLGVLLIRSLRGALRLLS